MDQKGFSGVLVIIIVLVAIGVSVVGYFVLSLRQESAPKITNTPVPNNSPNIKPTTSVIGRPSLSADKKDIVAGDKILLSIDDDAIFNWFKTKSQLCDPYNITTVNRKSFCENKTFFRKLTRFSSIVVSPDKMKIGFTIESDEVSPDKVVGIFLRSTNKVNLLTNYYLGNEFISFSPSGKYFVYRGYCWEGLCGLFIRETETLAEKVSLNNPESIDLRVLDAKFIRWLSDNEIEYKLGTELKQASF